jgi:hypothetical protein
MGRFAERTTKAQRDACASEKLDRGRSGADISRNGIPGIMPAGFISPAMANEYAKRELEKRRRAERGDLQEAADGLLWDLLDHCQAAERRYRQAKSKADPRDLARVADVAVKLQRAIASRPKSALRPRATDPSTSPDVPEKPSTLAERLEKDKPDEPLGNGNGNGEHASGAVQSNALAPQATHESTELLNHAAPHDAL